VSGKAENPASSLRIKLMSRSRQINLETAGDLLQMGGYGHSRFRDFVLGGATRQILGSPRFPTLLAH
jgi:nucleotide-binding universal stress UspA family protein